MAKGKKLIELSNTQLFRWYDFLENEIQKTILLNDEIKNQTEDIESKAYIDDAALKLTLIAKELQSRLDKLDFEIDYEGLSDYEVNN